MTPKQQQFVSSGGMERYSEYKRKKNTKALTVAGANFGFAHGVLRGKGGLLRKGLQPRAATQIASVLKHSAVGAGIGASVGLAGAMYQKHQANAARPMGTSPELLYKKAQADVNAFVKPSLGNRFRRWQANRAARPRPIG